MTTLLLTSIDVRILAWGWLSTCGNPILVVTSAIQNVAWCLLHRQICRPSDATSTSDYEIMHLIHWWKCVDLLWRMLAKARHQEQLDQNLSSKPVMRWCSSSAAPQLSSKLRTCDDGIVVVCRYLNLDYSAWQIPLPEDQFSDNENMQCPTVIQEEVRHVDQYITQRDMTMNILVYSHGSDIPESISGVTC